MGHDEAAVGEFLADVILLTDQTTTGVPAGTAGRTIVSGGKIFVSNGSTWAAT